MDSKNSSNKTIFVLVKVESTDVSTNFPEIKLFSNLKSALNAFIKERELVINKLTNPAFEPDPAYIDDSEKNNSHSLEKDISAVREFAIQDFENAKKLFPLTWSIRDGVYFTTNHIVIRLYADKIGQSNSNLDTATLEKLLNKLKPIGAIHKKEN